MPRFGRSRSFYEFTARCGRAGTARFRILGAVFENSRRGTGGARYETPQPPGGATELVAVLRRAGLRGVGRSFTRSHERAGAAATLDAGAAQLRRAAGEAAVHPRSAGALGRIDAG